MADLIHYLPDVIKEVKEYKAFAETENPEIDKIYESLEEVSNSQFLSTSGEYGIHRREKMLEITPVKGSSLDERRLVLFLKYNEYIPYTLEKLKELLDIVCNGEGYRLTVSNSDFYVLIELELQNKNQAEAVKELLERIVPVNMEFHVEVKYNTHRMLGRFTNEELSRYTHRQLREEELKKLGLDYNSHEALHFYTHEALKQINHLDLRRKKLQEGKEQEKANSTKD